MPKIIAHCLIKNEDRFIWYSLNSVLSHVDKILVWDTGSIDKTVSLLQLIKSPKIDFKEVGSVDIYSFTTLRQRMLDSTPKDYNWLMILDGDEIWPELSIKTAVEFCRTHPGFESVVVRTRNLVGDIYHSLPESSGHYHLAGHTGHLNLRFMNLKAIPGLHVGKPHGQQGYFDKSGTLIQDRDPGRIKFLDIYYHHATHLRRSSAASHVPKRSQKFKHELGSKLALSQVPAVFFVPRPRLVPDLTLPAPLSFWLKSALITPAHHFKRRFFPAGHGY